MASEQPRPAIINPNVEMALSRMSLREAGGDPQKGLEIYNRMLREEGFVPEDDPHVYPLDPGIVSLYQTWMEQQKAPPATAGGEKPAARKRKAPSREAETAAPEAEPPAAEPPAGEAPAQQQEVEAQQSGAGAAETGDEPEQDEILKEARERARARKQQGAEEKPALRVESGRTAPDETFEVRDSGARLAREEFERIGEAGRQRIEEERQQQRQATPPPPEAPPQGEQPEAHPAATQQAQPQASPPAPPVEQPAAPPTAPAADQQPSAPPPAPEEAPEPKADTGTLSVSAEEGQRAREPVARTPQTGTSPDSIISEIRQRIEQVKQKVPGLEFGNLTVSYGGPAPGVTVSLPASYRVTGKKKEPDAVLSKQLLTSMQEAGFFVAGLGRSVDAKAGRWAFDFEYQKVPVHLELSPAAEGGRAALESFARIPVDTPPSPMARVEAVAAKIAAIYPAVFRAGSKPISLVQLVETPNRFFTVHGLQSIAAPGLTGGRRMSESQLLAEAVKSAVPEIEDIFEQPWVSQEGRRFVTWKVVLSPTEVHPREELYVNFPEVEGRKNFWGRFPGAFLAGFLTAIIPPLGSYLIEQGIWGQARTAPDAKRVMAEAARSPQMRVIFKARQKAKGAENMSEPAYDLKAVLRARQQRKAASEAFTTLRLVHSPGRTVFRLSNEPLTDEEYMRVAAEQIVMPGAYYLLSQLPANEQQKETHLVEVDRYAGILRRIYGQLARTLYEDYLPEDARSPELRQKLEETVSGLVDAALQQIPDLTNTDQPFDELQQKLPLSFPVSYVRLPKWLSGAQDIAPQTRIGIFRMKIHPEAAKEALLGGSKADPMASAMIGLTSASNNYRQNIAYAAALTNIVGRLSQYAGKPAIEVGVPWTYKHVRKTRTQEGKVNLAVEDKEFYIRAVSIPGIHEPESKGEDLYEFARNKFFSWMSVSAVESTRKYVETFLFDEGQKPSKWQLPMILSELPIAEKLWREKNISAFLKERWGIVEEPIEEIAMAGLLMSYRDTLRSDIATLTSPTTAVKSGRTPYYMQMAQILQWRPAHLPKIGYAGLFLKMTSPSEGSEKSFRTSEITRGMVAYMLESLVQGYVLSDPEASETAKKSAHFLINLAGITPATLERALTDAEQAKGVLEAARSASEAYQILRQRAQSHYIPEVGKSAWEMATEGWTTEQVEAGSERELISLLVHWHQDAAQRARAWVRSIEDPVTSLLFTAGLADVVKSSYEGILPILQEAVREGWSASSTDPYATSWAERDPAMLIRSYERKRENLYAALGVQKGQSESIMGAVFQSLERMASLPVQDIVERAPSLLDQLSKVQQAVSAFYAGEGNDRGLGSYLFGVGFTEKAAGAFHVSRLFMSPQREEEYVLYGTVLGREYQFRVTMPPLLDPSTGRAYRQRPGTYFKVASFIEALHTPPQEKVPLGGKIPIDVHRGRMYGESRPMEMKALVEPTEVAVRGRSQWVLVGGEPPTLPQLESEYRAYAAGGGAAAGVYLHVLPKEWMAQNIVGEKDLARLYQGSAYAAGAYVLHQVLQDLATESGESASAEALARGAKQLLQDIAEQTRVPHAVQKGLDWHSFLMRQTWQEYVQGQQTDVKFVSAMYQKPPERVSWYAMLSEVPPMSGFVRLERSEQAQEGKPPAAPEPTAGAGTGEGSESDKATAQGGETEQGKAPAQDEGAKQTSGTKKKAPE